MYFHQLLDFLRHGFDESVDLSDSADVDISNHDLADHHKTLDSDLVGLSLIYFAILHSLLETFLNGQQRLPDDFEGEVDLVHIVVEQSFQLVGVNASLLFFAHFSQLFSLDLLADDFSILFFLGILELHSISFSCEVLNMAITDGIQVHVGAYTTLLLVALQQIHSTHLEPRTLAVT